MHQWQLLPRLLHVQAGMERCSTAARQELRLESALFFLEEKKDVRAREGRKQMGCHFCLQNECFIQIFERIKDRGRRKIKNHISEKALGIRNVLDFQLPWCCYSKTTLSSQNL